MEIVSTIGQILLWAGLIVVVFLVINWFGKREKAEQKSLRDTRAKEILTALPLRQKEAAVQMPEAPGAGDDEGVTTITTEKAVGLLSQAFGDKRLRDLIQEEDHIILRRAAGKTTSIDTIFRTGEDEFTVLSDSDAGGR
jgi:hypothetical protein